MKCMKCNSENVRAQVVTKKNPIMLGMMLGLGGLGLICLSIVGLIIGVILGLIVGAIIKAIMGDIQETVFVCQTCGNRFSPNKRR